MSFDRPSREKKTSDKENIIHAWQEIITKTDIPASMEINTDGTLLFKFDNHDDMVNFGKIIKRNFASKFTNLFVPEFESEDVKNQFSINNIPLKDFPKEFNPIPKLQGTELYFKDRTLRYLNKTVEALKEKGLSQEEIAEIIARKKEKTVIRSEVKAKKDAESQVEQMAEIKVIESKPVQKVEEIIKPKLKPEQKYIKKDLVAPINIEVSEFDREEVKKEALFKYCKDNDIEIKENTTYGILLTFPTRTKKDNFIINISQKYSSIYESKYLYQRGAAEFVVSVKIKNPE